ncbi:Protein Daple [Collichthys lucidus]|uniref:Protein Daple n=1 Tax=Collichthys lucidus TaxID=240159 RepID=A0A4U5VDW8_COLLU|nr:Protein Daple [Collichthys lucidus]
MDVTLSELLATFMESPLVLWVRTLGPLGSCDVVGSEERVNMFMELVDGVFLHKIMTHIDPSPTNQRLNKNVNNDVALRLHNLTVLTRHIRTYYQETLQQLIVMPLPNILCIAKDPISARSMEDLKRLLLLILGCAVQCERKEEMIEKIKLLDIETQAAIVSHIQEVTHNQLNVLDLSWLEEGSELTHEELEPLSRNMAVSLQQLINQRDKASEVIVDLTQERDYLFSQQPQEGCRNLGMNSPERGHHSGGDMGVNNGGLSAIVSGLTKEEKQHLSVELADTKSKLRRYRQELVYRDEVDSLREKASRVDRLETELSRCKEKLNDVHFYKTRVEERDNERRRLEELVEENMLLEIGQKQSMNESAHLGWELEQLTKNHDNTNTETRKSLVHELNECVSSRVLKLEKENRELQTSIERLKEDNHLLQEQQLHTQELDRENQSLSKKLERLQGLLDQERLTNQDMESLGEDILKEKQSLEREMHTLRAERDRQISELESEKQHLADAVASLQERAQSNNEARVREVEVENRLLHQNITDTSSRLASLETQLKLVSEEAERLRERAGRCEEVEREAARLERSRDALNREVTSLRACSERSEALEKQVSSLEQEMHRLKREAEEAQRELQRLGRHEAESTLLSKENLELRCSLENLRSSTARLATLQEEHKEAQRETQELHRRLEEAKEEVQGERKRVERLELNMAALNQEKHSLEEVIQRSKEEKEEIEGERRETHNREEELKREVEVLKVEQRRKEEIDKERRKLQLDLEQSEKGRKHLEKESWRIRTLLEGKETELEEKTRRLMTMEKEGTALSKEVNRLKEVAVKAKELERENKELQKQATIDKRTLATLREELVSAKLSVQQQSVELERLNEELEKIGLNREKLLQQEHTLEDRYRLLESRLEETVQQTMKIKEEKISSLERKLDKSSALNATLRAELATARQTLSALRQQQEEEENHNSQQPSTSDQGQGSATAELLRIKDHLIDVEKNNASLQTESSLLKEQLKQLENQNASLNSQMVAQQRHTSTLQEQNSALHTQTAKLQVENSTLSSQSASLMAQNAVLQGQVTALETETESWERQREEAWRGRESVLSDHERLLSVHERQAHEYEQLISQHTALKGKQRALESEYKTLQSKFTESQSQQSEQSEGLQQRMNELKSSLSSAQLDVSRWMARYDTLMEQHQGLDLTMTKLDNHCELLSRLKGNLEEENHHLLSQINLLSQQNHSLLERSMESKELYHQEQKLYIDKLNALRRQKEKLEEKIMDQYKFYDPTPKKRSQWSGAKALAKLIKPRKEGSRERGSDRDKEGGKDRERAKCAPDIPLPALPPLLPPETPPPVPLRTASDMQDGWPCSQSRGVYRSSTPGGSNESINGEDGHGQAHKALSSTPSHQSSLGLTNNCSSRLAQGLSRRPRGKPGYKHIRPYSEVSKSTPCMVTTATQGGRPGSADYSHNTSSSNSPVNCRDTSDRQVRSASLSSDDVMGLSQSHQTLSRSSTLPYDHTPQRAQPQRGVGVRTKTRSSSPGSEMVTLEQFLQESNIQSPPMVSTGSREDLMADYFRSPAPSVPTGRDQASPSPRELGQSLSRAFSLASADLLRSNGPDSFRGNEGQSDVVIRRQGGGANGRERPLSARLAGPTNQHGDGSLLNPPIHHSSSLNLQTERYSERERERGRTPVSRNGPSSSSSYHHRGEVAMVTPVRAVPATQPEEASEQGEVSREGRPGDSSYLKKESERVRCDSVERPKKHTGLPRPQQRPADRVVRVRLCLNTETEYSTYDGLKTGPVM